MTDPTVSTQWRQRLDECRQSRLSVQRWCSEHDIPLHRYYYWHKKLALPAELDKVVDWLPVTVSHAGAPHAALTVRVGSAAIEVLPGFEPTLLRSVVAALASER